jgi:hypothetical protein
MFANQLSSQQRLMSFPNLPAPQDVNFIMERVLQEAETEIDAWLDQDDHGANYNSLNV